jgi:hypothetical protein
MFTFVWKILKNMSVHKLSFPFFSSLALQPMVGFGRLDNASPTLSVS